MRTSYLHLTHRSGLQEAAAPLVNPVVVVRDTTGRIESVEAGVSVLAGRRTDAIVEATERLLRYADAYASMASADCPYGDGHAAERIVSILSDFIGDRCRDDVKGGR